jgi:hypothetical protein
MLSREQNDAAQHQQSSGGPARSYLFFQHELGQKRFEHEGSR